MRLVLVFSILFFCFELLYSPLSTQAQDLPTKPPKSRYLNEIGFILGIGTSDLDLRDLNKHLEVLQIGKVDNVLVSRTISLYMSGKNNFKATMDVNVGTAIDNLIIKPEADITFNTFSLGLSLYKSLFRTNRVEILLLGGFRFTNINFEYNANTISAANFDSLLSDPTVNASTIHLASVNNSDANIGGRFQFRLGKKENQKPREYRIGFDSGYIYGFRNSPWRHVGGRLAVPAMPKIKSDNVYFHLTFSGYFRI